MMIRHAAPFRLSLAVFLLGAMVVAGYSPPDTSIDGSRTSGDPVFPHVGNSGYDVDHYSFDINYSADGSIVSTAMVKARTTGPSLRSFSLDLKGLTVDAVSVDGVEASFERIEQPVRTEHKVLITPDTPVDGEFTATVEYHGTPKAHTGAGGGDEGWIRTPDGAITLNQPIGAMTVVPVNNTPRDKATFDVTLRLPDKLGGGASAGVSNGVLHTQTTDADGTATWQWRQPNEMAPHLLLIGFGRFDQVRSTVKLKDGRSMESLSFIDPAIGADQVLAAREALQMEAVYVARLEDQLGDYPGVGLGAVVDNSGVGYALETQDRPAYDGQLDQSTMMHELVHQWFGNAVTVSTWSDLWLAEGPAVFYSETEALDVTEYAADIVELYRAEFRERRSDQTLWGISMAGFDQPEVLFGDQVYRRGAIALAYLLDHLGAEEFAGVMRSWADQGREHPAETITTDDFLSLIAERTGFDTRAFNREWVDATDAPKSY